MSRIIVVGGPRTGKTTYAHAEGKKTGALVRHTDSLIGTHDWSQASAEAARWLEDAGSWIIEGVATARALRKWLAAHPGEPLNAKVVVLSVPVVDVTVGQATMAKGVVTVWREIEAAVRERGASVEVLS